MARAVWRSVSGRADMAEDRFVPASLPRASPDYRLETTLPSPSLDMPTRFILNGTSVTFDGDDTMPLLWYLRDHAALTGTKFGCGVAACGACTVHVAGRATRSCTLPVRAVAGREVVTIEGLASGDALHARGNGARVRSLEGARTVKSRGGGTGRCGVAHGDGRLGRLKQRPVSVVRQRFQYGDLLRLGAVRRMPEIP